MKLRWRAITSGFLVTIIAEAIGLGLQAVPILYLASLLGGMTTGYLAHSDGDRLRTGSLMGGISVGIAAGMYAFVASILFESAIMTKASAIGLNLSPGTLAVGTVILGLLLGTVLGCIGGALGVVMKRRKGG
ncbi:MAG TPA: DUF5518 domain-containing protein [Ktedonobacteraceae bacterium]|nr:DUF5518 domain-containing protein [Ktedonobacteraceae bacterium]